MRQDNSLGKRVSPAGTKSLAPPQGEVRLVTLGKAPHVQDAIAVTDDGALWVGLHVLPPACAGKLAVDGHPALIVDDCTYFRSDHLFASCPEMREGFDAVQDDVRQALRKGLS